MPLPPCPLKCHEGTLTLDVYGAGLEVGDDFLAAVFVEYSRDARGEFQDHSD